MASLPLVSDLARADPYLMFTVDCPRHGRPVLLPASRIRGLHNTDAGILLRVECWCGTLITVRTGRRAAAPAGHGSNL